MASPSPLPLCSIRVLATEPHRRSSRCFRLQNVTPVSYVDDANLSKEERKGRKDWIMEEGSKPEVYTEEHEKLLGSTELPWTLFVDGYGTDGKRIYDPVKRKDLPSMQTVQSRGSLLKM